MVIGGFQKFSAIDYPGKLCAIIFTRGCNMRCPYCHNPELVYPDQFAQEIPLQTILLFLKKRQGLLDAATITGGEPTIHADLIDLISQIKEMGYLVKLDTNGSNPHKLQEIIKTGLVDYFAMDVKSPLEKYPEVTRSTISVQAIRESIQLLMNSGIAYEFRTTVDWTLLNENDLIQIAETIRGAERYYLQKANSPSKEESADQNSPVEEMVLENIAKKLNHSVVVCKVR